MTGLEKFELTIVLLSAPLVFFLVDYLSAITDVGIVMLICSVVLLSQSLLRDLWLIRTINRPALAASKPAVGCMCLESTIGAIGVIAGIFLALSSMEWRIHMASWLWCVIIFAVLATGFLIKDFVFSWKPVRVWKDKNHINIVVW
ncbi:MAG: hypothetical protein ACI9FD_000866 [Gammaproteobacteria bacterium]|jgi:hypothetical protein